MQAAQIIRDSRGGRLEVPPGAISPDGQTYTFDWYIAPETPAPPLHSHPGQEERFEVLAGELTVTLGKAKHVLRPGDRLTVPIGALHAVANATEDETCVRVIFTPALDSHSFFEKLFAIDRSSTGFAKTARTCVLFRQMRGYVGVPGPARVAVALIALATRALGYRLPRAPIPEGAAH